MNLRTTCFALFALVPVTPACGTRSASDAGGSEDAESSSSVGTQSEVGDGSSEVGSSNDDGPETTTSGDEGGPTCAGRPYCDVFDPASCPDGQKCTAVGCEGDFWDAYVCVDIQGDDGLGEPCMHSGDIVSGLDSCGDGLICWNPDPTTGIGECLAHCGGSPEAPTCPEGYDCAITSSASPIICIPRCDPLADDCGAGQVCVPQTSGNGFACVFDASMGQAPYGTPCEYLNACNSGLFCIEAGLVPEPACEAASGCCSPVCDLDANLPCPGAGQSCLPWFEEGYAPPGLEHIGVCAQQP